MDPKSALQADIEEFWESPTLWKRTVTGPGFSQTITMNNSGIHVEDSGDYLPVWIRGFITAPVDPVPNADQWNRPDNNLVQTVFPSGRKSLACLTATLRMSTTESSEAHSSVCFFDSGLLSSVNQPGYDMEFNEFDAFRDKQIARLYMSQVDPGTYLVGKILQLETSSKKPSFFDTPAGSKPFDEFSAFTVTQPTIEKMAGGLLHIAWPPVKTGKTEGTVMMWVSVDRSGHVREATSINTDNPEITEAARDQLLQARWKPAVSNGNQIQVYALVNLPFSTTLIPDTTAPARNAAVSLPSGVVAGRAIFQPRPSYPPLARSAQVQGSVYLRAMIGKDGSIKKIGVIDSASQILTDAALKAVRDWRYQPYLLNGEPTEVTTTITVNFRFSTSP
jgi:TonB family protein